MDIFEIFKSEYLSLIFGGLGGIGTAWITQRVMNRRGLFSYFVNHSKIGISTNDSVFGNISVTWNENQVNHLFLSKIELKNDSFNDYENVVINTFTSDTRLLSESTQLADTPSILEWTDKFKKKLHVEPDEHPTDAQIAIYNGQREYNIPVFNRGQTVKINYLNSAISEKMPDIWLSTTIKGVKVKFRTPQNQLFDVPVPLAALVGVLIGAILLFPLVLLFSNSWLIAGLAMIYGFIAQIPGAFTVKVARVIRETIGG